MIELGLKVLEFDFFFEIKIVSFRDFESRVEIHIQRTYQFCEIKNNWDQMF